MPGVDGDYLDALLATPTAPEKEETPAAPITSAGVPERSLVSEPEATAVPLPGVGPRRKERFTVQIDQAIVEELRDAAVWFLMAGERASVAGLVESALRSELARLREEHFAGGPFPARPYDPPPGRRL